MIHKIIFNSLVLIMFLIFFYKMVKKNETMYLYTLIFEFIGFSISFICIFIDFNYNVFFYSTMYTIFVVLPFLIIVLEKKYKIDLAELLYLYIANLNLKSGNKDNAKEYLFKLLEKYPNSSKTHLLLAKIYEEEGKNEIAIEEYTRALNFEKDKSFINLKIANLLNKEQKTEESIEVLHEILDINPENLDASLLLGDIYFSIEKYKQADLAYMNGLRYNPADYDLLYNVAMTATLLNDFLRAKEYYEKAATINSLEHNYKMSLGQIEMIFGELEEAKKRFKQALEYEDLESGSYYYLAQISILKGNKEKAINYMNIAINLDYTLYEKMKEEEVFESIKDEIVKPKEEYIKENMKMSFKEIKTYKHLFKTSTIFNGMKNNLKQIETKDSIEIEKEEKNKIK